MSKNQTDKSIAEPAFFNNLTDVGKGFFLALRESFLSFVDEKYINRETIRNVDATAKIFTEQIDPDILNIKETINKLQLDISQLKSASTSGAKQGAKGN